MKLTGVIGQEMSDRKAADEKLNGKIDAEAVKRDAADLKLTGVIGQEISDRKAADVAEKWARVAADKKEADTREAEDKKLNSKINIETLKRIAADEGLRHSINTTNEKVKTVNAQSIVRDAKLDKKIADEANTRELEDKKLNSKIVAESWARSAADARLSERIDQSNAALDNETKERKAADAELSNRIHGVAKDVKKVGARAAALAGLHPLDYDETTKFSFAAATGSYKSEKSVALGAFYRPNKNVMVSAASTLGSDAAYNVGVSFKFGSETAKTEVSSFSTQQLYAAVAELQRQMAAQQQTIEEQQQEINTLKNAQNA